MASLYEKYNRFQQEMNQEEKSKTFLVDNLLHGMATPFTDQILFASSETTEPNLGRTEIGRFEIIPLETRGNGLHPRGGIGKTDLWSKIAGGMSQGEKNRGEREDRVEVLGNPTESLLRSRLYPEDL